MNNNENSNILVGGGKVRCVDRKKLSDCIPLSAPFSLNIGVSEICNFRCNYCMHSTIDGKKYLNCGFIDMNTFEKILLDASELSPNYNIVNLIGMGEPLLHPDIIEMVNKVRKSGISKRIEITTNASKLTPELSLGLINAGLTRLIVSIQGVTEEKYKEICGVKLNLDNLINNLKFFYENKHNTEVYIKIADTALEQEELIFYEMFSPYADVINIENTVPLFKDVDYTNIIKRKEIKSRYGTSIQHQQCCQMIFYALFIRPNGDVSPCCLLPEPVNLGNIYNNTLKEIWNGEVRNEFLKLHLRKERHKNMHCKGCVYPTLSSEPLDYLDDDAEKILKRFK
ncbi:MAG: SPASM domain-containing protein [Bacillales bacterium]|nr:SPASM domain-containing protein [Bacillales bacterium]